MSKQRKFALTPGLTSDQPIDYSTTWGLKQRTESTKKLSDNLYDGSPQNLKMFLERLALRVITAGWKTITKVDGKDLLTQYGTISIQDCKTAAQGYLKLDASGELEINKQSQMSAQMLTCIQASITDECALKVVISGESYEVEVKDGDEQERVLDGPLYLRILISGVTIDSRSTVSYIRRTLSELDDYMTSVDNNVTTFNEYVKLQWDALTARGESSSDFMVSLFKGYLAAPDKELATYIKQKKNNYKEGQDILEYDLMMMAENKYKSLVRSGEWNAPSKEQKEILALSAKLESFTKKKKSEKQDKRKDRFEWKKEAPNIIMDTRDKNGKTYHWCTKHNLWTLHKASEFKLESPKEDSHNKAEDKHKLQLKQALTAMEDDDKSVE